MMKSVTLINIVSMLVAVSLSACSALNTSPPEINLVDLKIEDVQLLETTMLATLRINNDSNKAISFSGSSHRIYVNEMELGRASTDQEISIPRLGSTTYTVPLRISSIGILTRLQRLIEARDFSYKIDSSFYPQSWFGLGVIKSSSSGVIGSVS